MSPNVQAKPRGFLLPFRNISLPIGISDCRPKRQPLQGAIITERSGCSKVHKDNKMFFRFSETSIAIFNQGTDETIDGGGIGRVSCVSGPPRDNYEVVAIQWSIEIAFISDKKAINHNLGVHTLNSCATAPEIHEVVHCNDRNVLRFLPKMGKVNMHIARPGLQL